VFTDIPEIEEVNLFTGDSKVIHFQNPKVQAIAASTYVGLLRNKASRRQQQLRRRW